MILHLPPDAPLALRLGADALLVLHIGGGTIGIASGAAVMVARKGGRAHRLLGDIFFVSMAIMATVGAIISPLLHDRVSTVAGIFTLYLLVTSWMTARRREPSVGAADFAALALVLGVIAAGVTFILMQNASPNGMVDGQPPQAPWMFAIFATIAAASDIKMLLRRGVTGAQRIARHLWRASYALFIATGSLFLGQSQLFPKALQDSGLLFIPALAPVLLLLVWVLRVRLGKRFRLPAMARQPSGVGA